MDGAKIILLALVLIHALPFVLTQLLVLKYPFEKWNGGKRTKRRCIAVNVLLNALTMLLVFFIYYTKTKLDLTEVLRFACSYQDISRLATAGVICLAVSVLVGAGEYMWLRARYRDQRAFHFSGKCTLLLLIAAVPVILGYYFGYTGTSELAIQEVCRKTTLDELKVSEEETIGEGSRYIVLVNNGVLRYEPKQLYLSDNEEELQAQALGGGTLQPGGTCLYFLPSDGPLAIKKEGGTRVYLSDKFGTVIDSIEVPALGRDESYRRTETGWVTVDLSTGEHIAKPPVFSAQGGFYDESFFLTLSAEEGDSIYYTLDGSDPTEASARYDQPILVYNRTAEPNVLFSHKNIVTDYYNKWSEQENVDKAFVVRAVAVNDKGNVSEIVTQTYFVDLQQYADSRVISLVTDPDNLFGENGIYVTGPAYDAWYEDVYAKKQAGETSNAPMPAENFQQKGIEWERIANLEAFENADNYLNQPVGIRIQGAASRGSMKKRFSVYSRKDYSGSKYFDTSPFDDSDEPIHSVVLRETFINSFSQELIEDRAVATQKSVPVTLFVNGEFLNQTYLQEKYSEAFFAKKYGLTADNIEILKIGRWAQLTEEEQAEYTNSISNYIENNDLADDAKYAAFGEIINIRSFIDFSCINLYLANADVTETKNFCIWRTYLKEDDQYGDTRWNWALYDMDLTTFNARAEAGVATDAEVNTFVYAGSYVNYQSYNQMPLFAALKANPAFCRQFVLTFMDLVNTTFAIERVAAKFEEWDEFTIETYNEGFFLNREKYIVPYMAEEFGLTGTRETVTLSADREGAPITLNTITPELAGSGQDGTYSWSGSYFTDYPVTVTADDPGFSHWEVTAGGTTQNYTELTIEVPVPKGGVQIHAVFK